jgi:ribonuclease D
LSWYEDEQAARMTSLGEAADPDPMEMYKKVKDWVSLSPREMAYLRELTAWREEMARLENLPRRVVFTDEGLIEFARFAPANKEAARKLRRVHQGQVNRYYEELRQVLARAEKLPRDQWPEKPNGMRPDIPTGVLELCQALVRTEAENQAISPTILATSSDLQRFVTYRDNLDPELHPILQGWRAEVVGNRLRALIRGELVARIGPGGSLVFEDSPSLKS